jgi:hypothetical protein
MLLYLRCVVANRATLAGIMFLILALVPHLPSPIVSMTCAIGFALLTMTRAGRDTYASYQKVARHYKTHQYFGDRFVDTTRRAPYCNRCGYRLALKDLGMSDFNVARRT